MEGTAMEVIKIYKKISYSLSTWEGEDNGFYDDGEDYIVPEDYEILRRDGLTGFYRKDNGKKVELVSAYEGRASLSDHHTPDGHWQAILLEKAI